MGNQQDTKDSKTPAKNPKPGSSKGGQDQLQQRSGGEHDTGGSGDAEHGSTRSYGNDQERARDSGQKSHE
jgi:hypothetical protein